MEELEKLLDIVSPFDETFSGGDKLYIRNNVLTAMKWAYNLALDKAAENATADKKSFGITGSIFVPDRSRNSRVNKESITSLKLK